MKGAVWGILWWLHMLEKEYGICATNTRPPATPVWFSPNQPHKLSRNLSLCSLRGEFLGLKTPPLCFVHEPGPWQKEGRCLIWIRGHREAMDKLWGACLPKLWALQELLAHKRWVAANQSLPRREAMPTHMLSLCICQADLPLRAVNHCHKKAMVPLERNWFLESHLH